MQVHFLNSNFSLRNAVVTLGTFDGVHTGHAAVISRLREKASSVGGESVVITFHPHPRLIIRGLKQAPPLLSTFEEKKELLEIAGIDHIVIIDFDKELSKMKACDFVEKILIERIGVKHLVVGFNHRLGREGEGNYDVIKQCAGRFNVSVEVVGEVLSPSGAVSSSQIREALAEGRLDEANKMLGYSYSIRGNIVEGKKIGREIGFPTANINPADPEKLIPANGVYAVEVIVGKEHLKGVMSIGTNPTVNKDQTSRTMEVNIFNFEREIYGSEIKVVLRFRLRDEMVFPGIRELAAQIEKDRIEAIALLG